MKGGRITPTSIRLVVNFLKRMRKQDKYASICYIHRETGVHNYTIDKLVIMYKSSLASINTSNGVFYKWKGK